MTIKIKTESKGFLSKDVHFMVIPDLFLFPKAPN